MGTLHKHLRTFMTVPRLLLLLIMMFHTKLVDKIKTHILRSVTFPTIVPFVRQCGKMW